MKKHLMVCTMLAATLAAIHARAQNVAASDGDKEAILDTVAQINHINWVVNVIKTYNNALILEEEYEKISYGNLNLNRIPDEETRARITKMLEVLHSLRKDEHEMKHWRGKFLDERMRKMRNYDLGTAKRVWGLFRETILGFMTADIGTVLETSFDIGHGCLSLQYDYDNFVHSFDQKIQDKVFAFDSQKMALLHELNKEMLDDQWRLVKKYHLDDKITRVTDTDIKTLLTILKDVNESRVYTRLASMKDRYRLLPEYWYYLSCAAMGTGHFKEGRDACDTFFKVNRGIFRDDPMAGTVALNKALMLDKNKTNFSELRRCLEIAWNANQNKNDWKQDFIVASLYDGILHDSQNAVKILEHAIACLESEMSERKRIHKDITALGKTLGEYHAFLFRLLPDEPMPTAIRTSEFISVPDKLRYLARCKEPDVWPTLKEDITCLLHSKDKDIPPSWLLSQSVKIKITYYVGETIVGQTDVGITTNADSTFTFSDDTSYDTGAIFASEEAVRKAFNVPIDATITEDKDLLRQIPDAFNMKLIFDYPEFPVVFTCGIDGFIYDFSIFGKKHYWQPESGIDAPSYSSNVTSEHRRNVFISEYGLIPLDSTLSQSFRDNNIINGIEIVEVKPDKNILSIKYRNVTAKKFRPKVTLTFMNEYGMTIKSDEDLYFDQYTKSHRTVEGIIFDDHYTDYNYRYMRPNEARTFSTSKPARAKYLLVQIEARNNLTETKEGTL